MRLSIVVITTRFPGSKPRLLSQAPHNLISGDIVLLHWFFRIRGWILRLRTADRWGPCFPLMLLVRINKKYSLIVLRTGKQSLKYRTFTCPLSGIVCKYDRALFLVRRLKLLHLLSESMRKTPAFSGKFPSQAAYSIGLPKAWIACRRSGYLEVEL